MLVTRQSSLTGETNQLPGHVPDVRQLFPRLAEKWRVSPATKAQMVGFCDWISIYQQHGGNLPRFADGAVLRIDKNGEVVTTTLKSVKVEGSHESAIFIRCDGDTVRFDGNVSKFGRPDNVFGYSFIQCIGQINNILSELGLPAFTEGDRFMTNFKGNPRSVWTGARVTRVDITQNFVTGSKENAYHFMRFLAGQQASRIKTQTIGDGETVDFGRGSRNMYFKVYSKGPELRKHISGAKAPRTIPHLPGLLDVDPSLRKQPPSNDYLLKLADWCDEVGLVRAELTVKSTKLHALGCNYLGGYDMKQLEIEFEKACEVFTRASAEVEEITELPKHLLSTYRMWQAGDALPEKLSRATFFRHRKELLPYGCDIAIKSNVVPLKMKTRVIRLGPASQPEWYELPAITRKLNGTHS
ncbi:phage/plasmid replication protein [Polaromonas sp. YR568]|uniref:phage/plasmid replication domain-containing protein n=1 Tax=Polaromonas sp. YR568 TaxID=1855301 RepID=UPI003137F44C